MEAESPCTYVLEVGCVCVSALAGKQSAFLVEETLLSSALTRCAAGYGHSPMPGCEVLEDYRAARARTVQIYTHTEHKGLLRSSHLYSVFSKVHQFNLSIVEWLPLTQRVPWYQEKCPMPSSESSGVCTIIVALIQEAYFEH